MNHRMRRRGFSAGMAALAASRLHAQQPGASGSIIVPFAAGTLSDTAARRYATLLADESKSPWVVENHPGGAGVVAARQFLARPADGRTLLWGYSGLVCNTPLVAKPPLEFNPAADFLPVSVFIHTPFVLVAGAGFAANDLTGLQQVLKARPEPLSFMPLELASANHLVMETLLQRLGVRGSVVSYRNVSQALLDIAEGRVETGVLPLSTVRPGVQAGKLKVIAVLAERPLRAAPAWPTVAGQGFGRFDFMGWMGLFLARGTPPSALQEHEKHLRAILRVPSFTGFLEDAGQDVLLRDAAESRAFVDSEVARYRSLLQALKLI